MNDNKDKERIRREHTLILEDIILQSSKTAESAQQLLRDCIASNKELQQKDNSEILVVLVDSTKRIQHHTEWLVSRRPEVILLENRENTKRCPSCTLPMDNLSDAICSFCSTKLPLPHLGREPV